VVEPDAPDAPEESVTLVPAAPRAPHPAPAPARPDVLRLPFRHELVVRAAETFAALGDPSRARIVAALLERELSVGELARVAGLTQSATSHHLRLLRDRRLVRFHRHGHQVYYSADDVHVHAMFVEAFRHLRHVQEQLPDHPYRLGDEGPAGTGEAGEPADPGETEGESP
jgi:ArsR family transcriptional regulator, lead/cadmium/zinc/bismuth-responsive transcriptional repressor